MMFFFNDTATTEICTLSLHDALPISSGDKRARVDERLLPLSAGQGARRDHRRGQLRVVVCAGRPVLQDRKRTRPNPSHANISYAVFCLKKKKLARCSHCPSCAPTAFY